VVVFDGGIVAEPGWYRDPGGELQLRYFDGERWTDQTRAFAAPTGAPDSTGPEQTRDQERPWWKARRRALAAAAGGVLALAVGGVAVAALSQNSTEPAVIEPAAVAEATPKVEVPEPEPEPEPVDLRNLAWDEQEWTTTCVESNEPTSVTLHRNEESGELWSAVGPDGDLDVTAMNYTVYLDTLRYGDVTGDGLDDAVFTTDCFLGNDYLYYVEVWSHDEVGQPVQLPPVLAYSKWDGSIDSHEVDEGTLLIHTSEPAPGDETPHLNGYPVLVTTAWSFDGDRWASNEISRTDTTPPAPEAAPEPEPAPEPKPEPESQPSSEPVPSACELLGGWHHLGEEGCAEILEGLAECERRMEADPDWIYSDDSGGWENIYTGDWQPPCDI
jgi:hypothetical protein